MNLSAPFIIRPVMTTFVMLTILLAGWFSFVGHRGLGVTAPPQQSTAASIDGTLEAAR